MDDALKLKVKEAILSNPHLFSARHNRDYLTIGIEIAPEFPELAKTVEMEDDDGNKAHAVMVTIEDVKAAMKFAPAEPEPKQ